MTAAVMPLPVGFGLAFDTSTAEIAPGVLVGGQPLRVLRVAERGWPALQTLRTKAVSSTTEGVLARKLLDAGLAHPVPPTAARVPDLTVVIPVHDRASMLDSCLSVLGSTYPVIVVDDASPDPAGIRTVTQRHGATLVRITPNAGPAAARNAGLRAVTSELVAFIDSDAAVRGDQITALAGHLRDPLVAAAAPRVRAQAQTGWVGRYTGSHCALDLGDRPALVRPYGAVSYVPTVALVARCTALSGVAETGSVFDVALRYGEDVDLVWRLLNKGWCVRYEPNIDVAHTEPHTWSALLGRRFRYGTSAAPLGRRHPRNVAPFIVHPIFTATVLAALAGRPVVAAVGAGACVVRTRHRARRAKLPTRRILATTLKGMWQTQLGLGRCSTQFAGPLLLVLAARKRPAALALLLTPAVASWRASDRTLDPCRYLAASILDEMAYGAGVLSGCASQRTLRALLPRHYQELLT